MLTASLGANGILTKVIRLRINLLGNESQHVFRRFIANGPARVLTPRQRAVAKADANPS
jgi:hypothetical protein